MFTVCVILCLSGAAPDPLFNQRTMQLLENSRRHNERMRDYERYMLDKNRPSFERRNEKPMKKDCWNGNQSCNR